MSQQTRVAGVIAGGSAVESVEAGIEAEIVLFETPFYAEQGGQVGDTGEIRGPNGRFRVEDTQKTEGGLTRIAAALSKAELQSMMTSWRRLTLTAAGTSCAITQRPTCCTPRCVAFSGRTRGSPDHSLRRTAYASTSRTSRP